MDESSTATVTAIPDIGVTIVLMGRGSTCMQMAPITRATGWMISIMDLARKCGLTKRSLREIITMERNMEKVSSFGPMEAASKATSKTIRWRVMECTSGTMVADMTESGRTTNSMVTVNSPGAMAESILVATNSTREMVKESSLGLMDANITVVG